MTPQDTFYAIYLKSLCTCAFAGWLIFKVITLPWVAAGAVVRFLRPILTCIPCRQRFRSVRSLPAGPRSCTDSAGCVQDRSPPASFGVRIDDPNTFKLPPLAPLTPGTRPLTPVIEPQKTTMRALEKKKPRLRRNRKTRTRSRPALAEMD